MSIVLTPRRTTLQDLTGKGRGRQLLAWEGKSDSGAGSQGWHKPPWLWMRGDGREAAGRAAVPVPGMRQCSRSCLEQRGRWPIACKETARKLERCMGAPQSSNTWAHRLVQEKKKILSAEGSPPAFLSEVITTTKICLRYQPPTVSYSHGCISSVSCCGEAKLRGRACSWISPATAAALWTAWGFPVKSEQCSTASEKLFSALKGFTKMRRQNIYAPHGLGLSSPTAAWLLGNKEKWEFQAMLEVPVGPL